MITRLDYRMDDMVAEGRSEAPGEVLTPLLNLSSGVQCSAPNVLLIGPCSGRWAEKKGRGRGPRLDAAA